MNPEFMDRLQRLRYSVGFPLLITSGYRDITHSIEADKLSKGATYPGSHSYGKAVDISCRADIAYTILGSALRHGFTGIGVAQSGANRFLHLDDMTSAERPDIQRPFIWSY